MTYFISNNRGVEKPTHGYFLIIIELMKLKSLYIVMFFGGWCHLTHATPVDPLLGTWKVIDERTGSYISDIVIRKNSKTAQYSAVVAKYYPLAGAPISDLCTKCQGGFKDKPIFGMQILSGLVADKAAQTFAKGLWINPQDGRTYTINTAKINTARNQLKVQASAKDAKSVSNMLWKKL